MSLIDTLNWRYACKKFDTSKKINEGQLDFLKESIRLTATSFGMQPFKVLIINNQELKDELKPVSWNQSQISDCSHLFVFCNYTKVTREMVDEYAALRAKVQEKTMEETMKYIDYLWSNVKEYSDAYINEWAAKQTYIALGNLLTAAGELKIDACPIEGFEKDKYDDILGLKNKNLASSVTTAIGYRAADEFNQFNNKVRKASEQMFELI